jgi:hypothetical protein
MFRRCLFVAAVLLALTLARADGPGDNDPAKVRAIPPRGIEVAKADRAKLTRSLAALGRKIDSLRKDPRRREGLLPDVEVFYRAVRSALDNGEFYSESDPIAHADVEKARRLLAEGDVRADSLRDGKAPWRSAAGLVVRGYRSRIDGSAQPYVLRVPKSYRPGSPYRHRLDIWLHGRNETTTEMRFLSPLERWRSEFTPRHAFVLYPFGRYCNAFKFAGEIDVLEAIDHVKKHYPIDEDRVVMRGFSMGGAGCWQFAVHYPGRWCAAAPGAGFSETSDFLKVFQKEDYKSTAYQRKLLHLYDCPDYALNLFNCPVVAYSGEKDRQKQAADVMERAMKKVGLHLVHVIGPGTEHSYHPRAKEEINWEQATVKADLLDRRVTVETANVSAFTLSIGPGDSPLPADRPVMVSIDGKEVVEAAPVLSDRSWIAHFRKVGGKWQSVKSAEDGTLRKRHALQGPIDDAFMDSFLLVRPTGKPLNDKLGAWVKGEMAHAITHWRRHFRGEARVKDDSAVTKADIAAHNLVLWGDPASNKLLGKIADKLPIGWTAKGVRLGKETFDAAHHVPVLIYPNPHNPKRYVVLNSGFTYREYDYLNNARQVPKLPDYAILDVRTAPSMRAPGKVVTAGFFDEAWRLPAGAKR